MAWFPLFLEMKDRPCLVVGGGKVALRKVKALLECGAAVTVMAPEILPELAALPVHCEYRKAAPGDADGWALVVDASGNPAVGEALAAACDAQGTPLNVVDMPQYCSFIFPAVLRRGRLTAAVSTGGASPLAAAWVRDRLDAVLPDSLEDILDQMSDLRTLAKATLPEQPKRAAFLRSCLEAALEKDRPLEETEIEALLKEGTP